MNEKHNTETSHNGYLIFIYRERPSHKLYFIAIDSYKWAIIGPNKKIVATHVVGKLEVLV